MLGALILVVMTGVRAPTPFKEDGKARLCAGGDYRVCRRYDPSGSVSTSLCYATARGSVKAEYLYVSFNNQTIGPGTFTLIENVVRGGVNYRF